MTRSDPIRVRHHQTADGTVSIGGIRWRDVWEVCIPCESAAEAHALSAGLAKAEPVAWMYDVHVGPPTFDVDELVSIYPGEAEQDNGVNVRPLYFAPPLPEPSLWIAVSHNGRLKYTTDRARAAAWKASGEYRAVRDYCAIPAGETE